MPSLFKSAAALALAGVAMANPFKRGDDTCLAAVTGKAALGDDSLRKEHCSSFIKTIVTPAAITVTTTVTDAPSASKLREWKRDVTVCPNEVPNYASACDESHYKSACSAWGVTGETTITIPATTTTKTVYNANGATCDSSTVTVTSAIDTTTVSVGTVTSTITSTSTKSVGRVTETVTSTSTKSVGTVTDTVTSTTTKSVGTVTETITVGFGGNNGTSGNNGGRGNNGTVTETVTTIVGSGSTATTTVTVGRGSNSTVTETVTSTVTAPGAGTTGTTGTNATTGVVGTFPNGTNADAPKCINDAEALVFIDAFIDLLEYTSYAGDPSTFTPAGRGYHQDVSDKYLAVDFKDYSDSINWMAGFPMGGVTFASKAEFDYGQGVLQAELDVTTLNYVHSCNTITWRWSGVTKSRATVQGINLFVLTEDLTKIQTNYAEFDNAQWLSSFGLQCKVPSSSTSTNSTSDATTTATPKLRMRGY
ncbi:hypothetical protein LTR64_006670 [Lithohypha guttulata]|uniref:uncharacterized protein n=1 Tax=Lithohypha guttulata TaxID=1690604 RepID=UPI002DE1D06C|nr:hypothetical protein LTR51_004771 [Lithohypha guttulata]